MNELVSRFIELIDNSVEFSTYIWPKTVEHVRLESMLGAASSILFFIAGFVGLFCSYKTYNTDRSDDFWMACLVLGTIMLIIGSVILCNFAPSALYPEPNALQKLIRLV